MKKFIYIASFTAVLVCLTAVSPLHASAASLYIESSKNTVSVGDTAIVTVKINAEGQALNTVEGDVTLRSSAGRLAVQEFSLANSAFGLWPRTPSLSADGNTITFVGGVPGGFNIEGATVFKIIVEAKKEGTVTIAPENISVFANDGSGTKVAVKTTPIAIIIQPKKDGAPVVNEWQSVVAADTQPPEDFLIVLGQDKSLFDGKKFAFFSALDNQSGIDYYEVSEDGAAPVRSGSTYVFKNQQDTAKLEVVAFDKAGNKKVGKYPNASDTRSISWPFVIVAVILIVVGVAVFKKWKNGKRNAPIQY